VGAGPLVPGVWSPDSGEGGGWIASQPPQTSPSAHMAPLSVVATKLASSLALEDTGLMSRTGTHAVYGIGPPSWPGKPERETERSRQLLERWKSTLQEPLQSRSQRCSPRAAPSSALRGAAGFVESVHGARALDDLLDEREALGNGDGENDVIGMPQDDKHRNPHGKVGGVEMQDAPLA